MAAQGALAPGVTPANFFASQILADEAIAKVSAWEVESCGTNDLKWLPANSHRDYHALSVAPQ